MVSEQTTDKGRDASATAAVGFLDQLRGLVAPDGGMSHTDRALHSLVESHGGQITKNGNGGYSTRITIGTTPLTIESEVSFAAPGIASSRTLRVETSLPLRDDHPFRSVQTAPAIGQAISVRNGIRSLLAKASLCSPPQEPGPLGHVAIRSSNRTRAESFFDTPTKQSLLNYRAPLSLALDRVGEHTNLRMLTNVEPQSEQALKTLLYPFVELALSISNEVTTAEQ